MILRQFLHTERVAISSLFGCGGKAAAGVVDPVGHIASYFKAARETGMRVRYVIDTHMHAARMSAGRRLAEAAGADYVLFAEANAVSPFRGARDGNVLPPGNVSVQVRHTPGHTPEQIPLLVTDRTRSDEPWFALTDHTLMVGDVGRTELGATAEEAAHILFRSPQRLKVLPGEFAGSLCGRRLSSRPVSAIGSEQRHNMVFRIEDEEAFVRAMSEEIPPPPPGAAKLRAANAGLELI